MLAGAGVLVAGVSLGDELLALVATDVEEHVRVDRVGGPGGVLSPDVGVTLRLGSALTTADGTDLLLFGQDISSGQQYLWRVGRTASGSSPAALAGPYQAIMGNRVLLSATAAIPKAAWVGTEARHVALATGDGRVTFHEPIERTVSGILAPATPPGWPSSQVTLPAGSSAKLLAAGSPTRLFVADGVSASVLRLEPGAAPVTCTVSGGGQVTGLAGLPSGGAVATLGDSTSTGGRLAVLPPDCSGPVDPATSPEPAFSFTAVDAIPGSPARVFASGNNGTLRAFELSGASLTSPVTQNVDVGGAVAAALLAGAPNVLVAGVDTGIEGYRLRLLSGGGFSAVADTSDKARAVVASRDPAFGLSTRIVELDSLPANQRVSLVRLYGAMGQTLRLYPGTCQRTSVLDAYDMGAQVQIGKSCTMATECPSGQCVMGAGPGRCAPFLATGATSGGTLRPTSNDFILAVAQAAQGEDCQMVLASDPATPGRGGGALLRVRGGTLGDRAIALVLDKSGSMFERVDSAAASGPGSEVRVDALRNAVALFIDTVAQLPDAAAAKFAVIPFNQQSSAGALPAAGLLSGTDLKAQYMDTILSPAGSTNIRGALKTAADRLAAQAGLQERSVLLLTDGLHNVVGTPETNSASLLPDDVNNLEPPIATATSTSAYLTAPGGPAVSRRVDRLYAVGLSPMSVHPSLVNLVRHVNAPSSVEPIPPGYLDYSLRGNEVAQFFSKVLWGYIGATEFVDPLVTVDTGQPYQQEIVVSPNDRELIVAVSSLDPQRIARARLTYTDANGMAGNLVRCMSGGQNGGGYRTVCYADPVALKSNGKFSLTVTKDVEAAAGPLEVMVEVAGRSNVRLRTAYGEKVHRTGGKMRLLATLTEQGLPIPPQKGGKVTGTLSLPAGALGTVLANLKVDAARIDELRKRDPDQFSSGAAAKFSLLPAGQAPGRTSQPIELFDDGQHGDGQAGDGVYGLEIEARVPGIYRAQLRGAYATQLSGTGAREASLATQVVVGLDGKLSLQGFTQYVPATKERPGSFVATLRPQDGAGNLLGPGNGGDILFRQGDRTLPAKITEPPELDGTYTAEVTDVRPGVPVLLVGSGGGALLLRDPACDPTKEDCNAMPPMDDGDCHCSLGRGRAGGYDVPLPALLLGLLGLGLLVRGRRRRLR